MTTEQRKTTTTVALAALLLSTTSTAAAMSTEGDYGGVPPSRIIRNEDLFDIMLSQTTPTTNNNNNHESSSSHAPPHDDYHRHLSSIPTTEKSSIIRNNWLSISPTTQFLPNVVSSLHRHLGGGYSTANPYYAEPFVDGMAEYDEDSQSWRKLGFIIDCNANDADMYEERSQHSGDNAAQVTETGCARYLIWAAYVNENYQGKGAAEYQYYDPYTSSWDKTACSTVDDSPCTKMDCHLSSTSFSLLGFFKHKIIDDWMEQLFKHQGICTWDDEDYAFMKEARKAWPEGCTPTYKTTSSGQKLYYDLKPMYGGEVSIAMYIDEECVTEYYMSADKIEAIIGNILVEGGSGDKGGGEYDFSSESLSKSLSRWNTAFDFWNVCHSCVAHDLSNTDGKTYYGACYDDAYYNNDDNDDDKQAYYNSHSNYYGYKYNGGNRALGGESCPKGEAFECYDDAGYTSVNQCMKFSAKTVMTTASFRDLSTANLQGTLTSHSLSGFVDQRYEFHSKTKTNALTYTFLISMSLFCIGSLYYLVQVIREARRSRSAVGLSDRLV